MEKKLGGVGCPHWGTLAFHGGRVNLSNPESGTLKYSKCQTPPCEKIKLLLNEYLGDFMHFETLFFSVEMGLTHPQPP